MYRTIVEERPKNSIVMDVFSKLVQERIIFIDDVIDDELANGVIAQMLYLDSIKPAKEISIYINTPGGSVLSGLAIYDVSKLLVSPIKTVGIGQATSMGAVLMLMGKERCATKHCRFMFHQPSGGVGGTAEDIKIGHEEMQKLKRNLYDIIETNTLITDAENLFKFDVWYTAEEALKWGILTKVL